MLRLRFRKIGFLLGLLAILMTSLAPTISQAMAAQHRVDALLADYCAAHAGAVPDSHAPFSSHDSLSSPQACGYCSLLSHTPALPTAEATFVATVRVIQHREATRFESLRRALPLTAAKPRAPPSAS